jgi:hypothetical protein
MDQAPLWRGVPPKFHKKELLPNLTVQKILYIPYQIYQPASAGNLPIPAKLPVNRWDTTLLNWWIETLIQVREEEGCISGPEFGNRDSSVALMREYDENLHYFLETIQREHPDLISELDDIQANYGLSRTFRRTAEGRAQAANLDTGIQNAMNRWKKIEQTKGMCSRFNMVDHNSHARDLMHVTWRYLFVQ